MFTIWKYDADFLNKEEITTYVNIQHYREKTDYSPKT